MEKSSYAANWGAFAIEAFLNLKVLSLLPEEAYGS